MRNNKTFKSIIYPLTIGNDGYFNTTNSKVQSIKTNIHNFLKTKPNQRLMFTQYLNIYKYLYQQNIQQNIDSIQSQIRNKLQINFPQITLKNVNVVSLQNQLKYGIVLNIDIQDQIHQLLIQF